MPTTPTQPTDTTLLQQFAQTKNPAPFHTLATRHLDWIYSTALRLTHNPAHAEDVTQSVLLALSQKAHTLQHHPALISWLFRATHYSATTLLRAERRRKQHEAAAMPTTTTVNPPDTDWLDIQPRLDAAVAKLSPADRHALLLRFYQQRTHPDIATNLNISEEAARKRVDRALQRLRKLLGLKSTTASLSTLLATSLLTTAPKHLHAAITSATLSTPHAVALTKGIHTMLLLSKLKLVAAVALITLIPITTAAVLVNNHLSAPHVVAALPPPAGAPIAAPAPDTQPAPSADVTGIVLLPNHQPAPNILVTATSHPDSPSTRTSADGRFSLHFDEDSVYSRFLLARTDDRYLQTFKDRADATNQLARTVQLTLQPARQFPISISDEKSTPIPGAKILASASQPLGDATSDAAGKATLLIPADAPLDFICAFKPNAGFDYTCFWSADPAEIHADPYHLPADFKGPLAFILNGAKSLTIRVADDQGKPIPNANVYPWYFQKPKKGGDANLSGLRSLIQHTNQNGDTTFAYIPADNATQINFWTKAHNFTSPDRTLYDPHATTTLLTATLEPLIPVSGRVIDEAANPVPNASVCIAGAGYQFDEFSAPPITTHADGTFSISVDPEKYYVLLAQKNHDASDPLSQIIHKSAPDDPLTLTLHPGRHVVGTTTAGPDHHPLGNLMVSLVLQDRSYAKLPKADQFPGGTTGRKSIIPVLTQYTQSDATGHFDFYTSPGQYYAEADSPSGRITQRLTLAHEPEHAIELHSNAITPEPALLHGRVVLSDKSAAPLADVTLSATPADLDTQGLVEPSATSSPDGTFQLRRLATDFYLHAVSPDKSHQSLRLITPADPDNLTIHLAATASATGRILNATGAPIPNLQLNYGFRITAKTGKTSISRLAFGAQLTTAADGTFTLPDLIPSVPYELTAPVAFNTEGHPFAWKTLTTLTPDSATPQSLGDLVLPQDK